MLRRLRRYLRDRSGASPVRKHTLCKSCFHLVPRGKEGVLCRSSRCRNTRRDDGTVGPARLNPELETSLRHRSGDVRIDVPCPICGEENTLRLACPHCWGELPDPDTDDFGIAVLGAKDAGKTHYLAALYHVLAEAPDHVGGEEWELEIEEDHRSAIRRELWRPLFEEKRELAMTSKEDPFLVHLILRHRDSRRRVAINFQDLSGEVLSAEDEMARQDFLLHARGVILLADADVLRRRNPKKRGTSTSPPSCSRILEIYTRVLERRSDRVRSSAERGERRLLPEDKSLAIAVTKADLVLRKKQHDFFWNGEGPEPLEPGFWGLREEQSRRARKWLLERTGRELARLAKPFDGPSYFFVSSYGYRHEPRAKIIKPPTPLRVHEPLFALLDRFAERDSVSNDDWVGAGDPGPQI